VRRKKKESRYGKFCFWKSYPEFVVRAPGVSRIKGQKKKGPVPSGSGMEPMKVYYLGGITISRSDCTPLKLTRQEKNAEALKRRFSGKGNFAEERFATVASARLRS
jgi:hypothetical protein